MAIGSVSKLVDQLRRATLAKDAAGTADEQLLACFLDRQDQAAFEALVRRHGPMVFGVCRRVLGHTHDAEDAFQVTFLVLVRKGASIRRGESLASWLYGVAYRTAQEARGRAARRRVCERQVPAMPNPSVDPEAVCQETQQLLDQELSQLSDKYRVPVILCELEGRPRKEVASLLHLSEGTLSSRLATARKKLAGRLAGRGVVLSASALTAALTAQAASASVPPTLIHSTVQAAMSLSAGQAAATGAISAELASLLEGVSRTMFLTQLKKTAAVLLLAAIIGGGAGLFGHHALADKPELAAASAEAPALAAANEEAPVPDKAPDGTTFIGQFVSFKPGLLRLNIKGEEKGLEVAGDTKTVDSTKKEGLARDVLPGLDVGTMVTVTFKGRVAVIEIGGKKVDDKPKDR